MYFLARTETLQELREKLQQSVPHPVYFCSTWHAYRNQVYRPPGDDGFRAVGRLEGFLSTWIPDYDIRLAGTPTRMVLTQATRLHFAYPLSQPPAKTNFWSPEVEFTSIGLVREINNSGFSYVFPFEGERIPAELEPYMCEYQVPHERPPRKARGILFAVSQSIERPHAHHNDWHIGYQGDVKPDSGLTRAATLHPPGWYSGRAITRGEDLNSLLVVERSAGRCIVCHGKSGSTVHLAVVNGNGYPTNYICRKCTPEAFAQIQTVLDSFGNEAP